MHWLRFEWLLIARNRRCRAILIPTWAFMLVFPLLGDHTRVLASLQRLDGILAVLYGLIMTNTTILFMSESSMYDRLSTLPVGIDGWLRRKLRLARAILICHAIPLSIALLWFGASPLSILVLVLFYLLALPVIPFQMAWHRTRFEIDQRASFNFQGADSSIPFLAQVPFLAAMVVPASILLTASFLTDTPEFGRLALGSIVAIMFLVQKPVVTRLAVLYRTQHYEKAAGYRQKV